MKTSISSKALSQFGAEKIMFPPKPDIQTDGHTDRCIYAQIDIQTDGHTDRWTYGQMDIQTDRHTDR